LTVWVTLRLSKRRPAVGRFQDRPRSGRQFNPLGVSPANSRDGAIPTIRRSFIRSPGPASVVVVVGRNRFIAPLAPRRAYRSRPPSLAEIGRPPRRGETTKTANRAAKYRAHRVRGALCSTAPSSVSTSEDDLDQSPARRKIRVAFGQSPNRVNVVGQYDKCMGAARVCGAWPHARPRSGRSED